MLETGKKKMTNSPNNPTIAVRLLPDMLDMMASTFGRSDAPRVHISQNVKKVDFAKQLKNLRGDAAMDC